jgi:hypothetical protein
MELLVLLEDELHARDIAVHVVADYYADPIP